MLIEWSINFSNIRYANLNGEFSGIKVVSPPGRDIHFYQYWPNCVIKGRNNRKNAYRNNALVRYINRKGLTTLFSTSQTSWLWQIFSWNLYYGLLGNFSLGHVYNLFTKLSTIEMYSHILNLGPQGSFSFFRKLIPMCLF